jgi:hypothetical protein
MRSKDRSCQYSNLHSATAVTEMTEYLHLCSCLKIPEQVAALHASALHATVLLTCTLQLLSPKRLCSCLKIPVQVAALHASADLQLLVYTFATTNLHSATTNLHPATPEFRPHILDETKGNINTKHKCDLFTSK